VLHVNTEIKMEGILKKNSTLPNRLNRDVAEISLQALQTQVLTKLNKNEIITDKLFIMLNHELQKKIGGMLSSLIY
jgi:monovalent cation:H+ antiporter, CPA1 family